MAKKTIKRAYTPPVVKPEVKPSERTHTFDPMGGKNKWIKKDGKK